MDYEKLMGIFIKHWKKKRYPTNQEVNKFMFEAGIIYGAINK